MTLTHPEAEQAARANGVAASLVAASAAEDAALSSVDAAAEASHAELAANAEARGQIRRRVDRTEFRLAIRDLREGVRGMIRVAPFTAVLLGVAAGLTIGARRAKRRTASPAGVSRR